MTDLSVSTFLQAELQRLRDWLTDTQDSLGAIDTIATVGDCIEAYSVPGRFPDSWHVEREMVQFGNESLAEVVRLTDSGDGYRITLKPVAIEAPTDTVEIYTRRSPFESRQHRTTVDSLSTALEEAQELAVAREQRPRQSTGRESRNADR